jgi:peroxiredoxin
MLIVLALGVAGLAYLTRPWASDGDSSGELGMLSSNAPRPGDTAPNFALADQDGRRIELSDFAGRPVFLNFWADWCTFCKEEMPDMQRIADEFGDRLVVVGVNTGDSVETGERFAQRAGVTYTRLYDLDLEVTEGYGIQAMPTSYFIDAGGRIVDYSFGVLAYEQMLAKVTPMVGE